MDEPDKIDVSTNCPVYANAGCYIGSNTHASLNTDDLLLEEVYKGCSTFEYDEFNKGKIENVTSSNGNFDINVCKEYCVGKDCNKFHTYCGPEDSPIDPTTGPGLPTTGPDGSTDGPTEEPTDGPTEGPTDGPTDRPTDGPTGVPTNEPTDGPTDGPTGVPTDGPTDGDDNDDGSNLGLILGLVIPITIIAGAAGGYVVYTQFYKVSEVEPIDIEADEDIDEATSSNASATESGRESPAEESNSAEASV